MNKSLLNKTYYQTNKELIKARQKQRYQSQKQSTPNSQSAKYYQANNIKILLSLKEYTNLNKETKKL
jgi:hypothetical protein